MNSYPRLHLVIFILKFDSHILNTLIIVSNEVEIALIRFDKCISPLDGWVALMYRHVVRSEVSRGFLEVLVIAQDVEGSGAAFFESQGYARKRGRLATHST